jgi:LysR family transcriptional regulator, regulator for bpeEF and oprC
MRDARVVPPTHAREAWLVGEHEALVVVEEPEAHEDWREHDLRPSEPLEEEAPVGAVVGEERVELGMKREHPIAQSPAPPSVLVHHELVACGDEVSLHGTEHVLDGAAPGIALRDGSIGEAVLQIAEDDEALPDDLTVLRFEHRQPRRAAQLREQRGIAGLRDVHDLEANVVAELRSFTDASRALGITPSGVGKSIARLETSLGARLLHRTTRRIGLTDDGAVFFEQCRRILDELESARGLMSNRGAAPRGRLRVSVPITIGKRIIVPELTRFLAEHPDVELDVSLSDRHVNLVEDGIDVAVRIGSLADSSLVARPIGRQQVVTIASAAYLAANGVASLGDLALRRCISFRLPSTGRERAWTFRLEGRPVEWRPRSFLTLDDGEALVAAARAGLGVTQVPSYMADDALASGELVEFSRTCGRPPSRSTRCSRAATTRRRARERSSSSSLRSTA